MASDLVVALDIGTTKVCALVAEVGADGRHQVIAHGLAPSTGIRRGVVVDVASTVAAIQDAVGAAQSAAGVEIRSVVVGVTGEHISSVNSRGILAISHPDRIVQREDVERVLDNARLVVLPPDRELLHSIPRGFSVDGQSGIQNPVGMCGTRLEVETHVVTGARALLQNVVTCVEGAGLILEELVLEPAAAGEAVLLPAERELGVALVDIGGGTSDIAIFRGGGICFSGVVPLGGQRVTLDIAAALGCAPEEAERVKRTFAVACESDVDAAPIAITVLGHDDPIPADPRFIARVVEARLRENLELIRTEIRRSGLSEMLPAGVVLTGGGALIPGLSDLACGVLGLRVRVGAPRVSGPLAETLSVAPFATSVGLVRWASVRAHGGGASGSFWSRTVGALFRRWRSFWG